MKITLTDNVEQKLWKMIFYAIKDLNETENECSDIYAERLAHAQNLCSLADLQLSKDGDFYYCQ